MTTPSIGANVFLTMSPDIVTAPPAYIDQQSTGRDGTDTVLDAWRASPQTIQCAQVYPNYDAAVSARELIRSYANTVQTVTDASNSAYPLTRIRAVRPAAFAQADGTGLLLVEADILIKSVPPSMPPVPIPDPTPPPPEPEP